jgi:hypothetical protein
MKSNVKTLLPETIPGESTVATESPKANAGAPSAGIDRRLFCQLLGGGIVVLITSSPSDLFAQRRGYPEI